MKSNDVFSNFLMGGRIIYFIAKVILKLASLEFHKCSVEWLREARYKRELILYDYIYAKYKTRQNPSVVLEVWIVATVSMEMVAF